MNDAPPLEMQTELVLATPTYLTPKLAIADYDMQDNLHQLEKSDWDLYNLTMRDGTSVLSLAHELPDQRILCHLPVKATFGRDDSLILTKLDYLTTDQYVYFDRVDILCARRPAAKAAKLYELAVKTYYSQEIDFLPVDSAKASSAGESSSLEDKLESLNKDFSKDQIKDVVKDPKAVDPSKP